ncbi:hypothetical protein HY639_06085 [Candidatus Woesearchaeota archaeon]|nr:hypothetical protein [Candidatus Woesearchaeota archaeon]
MPTKQDIEKIVNEGNLQLFHCIIPLGELDVLLFKVPVKKHILYVIDTPQKRRLFLENVLFAGQYPGDGERHYSVSVTSVKEEGMIWKRLRVEGVLEKCVDEMGRGWGPDHSGKSFCGYVVGK